MLAWISGNGDFGVYVTCFNDDYGGIRIPDESKLGERYVDEYHEYCGF